MQCNVIDELQCDVMECNMCNAMSVLQKYICAVEICMHCICTALHFSWGTYIYIYTIIHTYLPGGNLTASA